MKKSDFCNCLDTLCHFSDWERKLYECGFDLEGTPAAVLAENLHAVMCDFNPDWAYDTKLGIDWIIEWSCNQSPIIVQHRHGREWHLDTPGLLYDFIVFMNEYGWED